LRQHHDHPVLVNVKPRYVIRFPTTLLLREARRRPIGRNFHYLHSARRVAPYSEGYFRPPTSMPISPLLTQLSRRSRFIRDQRAHQTLRLDRLAAERRITPLELRRQPIGPHWRPRDDPREPFSGYPVMRFVMTCDTGSVHCS